MSYNINGKAYTEHPLMDEIIYNAKIILNNIVVKNDVLANKYETEETIKMAELFSIMKDGRLSFSICPLSFEVLVAFGYSRSQAQSIMNNKDLVPEEDRDQLVAFVSKVFVDNYEEKNDYYRMLMGLPEYGTDEYNVYIDQSYLPPNYKKEIDFSKPLHEIGLETIAILEATGKIEEILQEYRGPNYTYLKFIGDRKLDNYTIRHAGKWDILYMPYCETLVRDRFQEIYDQNKNVFLKRSYQEAFAFSSDYYEEAMILMVLGQTMADIVVDVPEWYIRRDIFDIRSVQYFLESFGVKFFNVIPLKYQIRIVKNLNKLIKYKSSDKNYNDILEIFALKNTSINEYYLYKKRLTDGSGNYLQGDTKDIYDLEFIQTEMGDTFDNYIKDQLYRTTYDDITYQDKYWDGVDSHDYIRDLHKERDFTIEGTKYMSIEYKIPMSEYVYQMQYFLGLILSSTLECDISIPIPSLQSSVTFKLTDLFLFLSLISLGYDNATTEIRRPDEDKSLSKPEFEKYRDFNGGYSWTPEEEYENVPDGGKKLTRDSVWFLDADGGKGAEYSEIKSQDNFYDWLKRYFPELFIEEKNRVYGFNSDVDLNKINEIIGRRHSEFFYDHGKFTLEDLGVAHYQKPNRVSSIDELVSLYNNNTECYHNIKSKMIEDGFDDRDEFMIYEFVFKSLFTKEFDYGFYKKNNSTEDATNLEEVLEDRDYILYNIYLKLMSEKALDVRRDNIRSIMNDIVSTLEYYLSGDGLEYIFSFTTVASFTSLINYIYLMIGFFKSYKVYFLDPYITYLVDDKLENAAGARYDTITERKITLWKDDKFFARDNVIFRVIKELDDTSPRDRAKEVLDVYGSFEPDPYDDYDYDGMYAEEPADLEYKMADGGHADPMSCVPYKMLNGGPAQCGIVDLWDLNGAYAREMQQYYDVDGGYALDPEILEERNRYSYLFNYIIDGGSASTNTFMSRTAQVQVIDRAIKTEARVSKIQYNALEEREDGLYLAQQWASWEEFDDLDIDSSNTLTYFDTTYNIMTEALSITADPDRLDANIQRNIDSRLEGARLTVKYMATDTFENNMNQMIDDKVALLYSEFYGYSPYDWGTF